VKRFAKMFKKLAEKHEYPYDNFDVELYYNALEPLGLEAIYCVMLWFYANSRGGRNNFPSIADIKEKIVGKPPAPKEDANAIANRIYSAIARYGYCGDKEAEKYIGDIGWAAIGGSMGYINACKSVIDSEKSYHIAQWRDHSEAMIGKLLRGEDINAPIMAIDVLNRTGLMFDKRRDETVMLIGANKPATRPRTNEITAERKRKSVPYQD
jgi:hypothetical protein